MWLVEKSLEALGSCGLDVASARKSRGPGVGEHEALARVFSVEKPRGPGVGEHEVDLCELWFGCSQCARFGAHRAEKSRGPGIALHEVPSKVFSIEQFRIPEIS